MVDVMSDLANIAYGAVPERLYIIRDGIVKYQGGVGPFRYSLTEVRQWLSKFA